MITKPDLDRRVIDAVTGHCDGETSVVDLLDLSGLLIGEDLGEELV